MLPLPSRLKAHIEPTRHGKIRLWSLGVIDGVRVKASVGMTMSVVGSRSRVGRWRVRSPWAAVTDWIMVVAGAAIISVAAADSLVSWPSDTIWITSSRLERIVGIVLLPAWIWLMASVVMVFGIPRGPKRTFLTPRPRKLHWRGRRAKLLAVIALFCLGVVVGGFVIGGAKGSLRVTAGPQYQVSTLDQNAAEWVTVSAAEYRVWEARFIREDGLFTFFGLWILGGAMAIAQVRREVTAESSRSGAVPPTPT
jgi:hypothetical protein